MSDGRTWGAIDELGLYAAQLSEMLPRVALDRDTHVQIGKEEFELALAVVANIRVLAAFAELQQRASRPMDE